MSFSFPTGSSSACRYGVECTVSWQGHGGIKIGILLGAKKLRTRISYHDGKIWWQVPFSSLRFRFYLRYVWMIQEFDLWWFRFISAPVGWNLSASNRCWSGRNSRWIVELPRTLAKSIGRGLHILKVSWWPANMASRLSTLILEASWMIFTRCWMIILDCSNRTGQCLMSAVVPFNYSPGYSLSLSLLVLGILFC